MRVTKKQKDYVKNLSDCGFHTEDNLRVITAKANRSKHNKFSGL